MSTVTGERYHHCATTPYVEGIEYFNYTDFDITITDKLGIETELLRSNQSPTSLSDRGKVIARVTRVVDPRRVKIPSTDAMLAVDRMYLESFKNSVELQRSRIGPYVQETEQTRMACQAEVRFEILLQSSTGRSNLLGITVRTTSNIVDKSHGNTPDGFIRDIILPELREADRISDEGVEKGTRTLFSARLIDNSKRVGTLWTSGFGKVTKIIPVIDEEQQEGLYLAGGLQLEHKEFIPIEELMDPKRMLGLNVHQTEIDARKLGLGEHTVSVITEREKIRKEKNDLKIENKKLQSKVDDLEDKIRIDRINKAHSDFKQTVATESLKENNVNNALGNISRVISLLVTNIKTFIGFVSLLKVL